MCLCPLGEPAALLVLTRCGRERESIAAERHLFEEDNTMTEAPSMPHFRRFTSSVPHRTRGRWRTAIRAVLLVAVAVGAGAWGCTARSCCERRACQDIRFLKAQIGMNYAMCCQGPAEERSKCLSDLQDKANATLSLILTAKQACDNNNNALLRETIQRIRDLWLPKVIKTATGQVVNQMVAFGSQDYLVLDTTLPRLPDSCTPVTVSIVGGAVVNAEATGRAAEDNRALSPEAVDPEVALVVPSNATTTYNACTYAVPANTTFNMRFGGAVLNGLSLSGTIAVAQTAAAFPAVGVGPVGLPTDVSLTASFLGQKITLDLDKTCPYNVLRVDASGNGALCVALTVDSDSPDLVGFVQIGSTIYFELPVQVAGDWSAIRIHADASIPGHLLTPTDPVALAAADGPSSAVIAEDPCADANENGIRDGADEVIHNIDSHLNCQATVQH